jgi:hypothetical protein
MLKAAQAEEQTVGRAHPALPPVVVAPGGATSARRLPALPRLLAELDRARDATARAALYPALTETLCDLRPDEGPWLGAAGLRVLRAELSRAARANGPLSGEECDFLVAAVKALATVADPKAIPVFRRWSRRGGDGGNADVAREAAREFLPILEAEVRTRREHGDALWLMIKSRAHGNAGFALPQQYLAAIGPSYARIVLLAILRRLTSTHQVIARFSRVISASFVAAGLIFGGSFLLLGETAQLVPCLILLAHGFAGVVGRRRSLPLVETGVQLDENLYRAATLFHPYSDAGDLELLLTTLRMGNFSLDTQNRVRQLLHGMDAEGAALLTPKARAYLCHLARQNGKFRQPKATAELLEAASWAVHRFGLAGETPGWRRELGPRRARQVAARDKTAPPGQPPPTGG